MKIKSIFFKEFSLWWFSTKYVSLLICCTLPRVLCMYGLVKICGAVITDYTSIIFSKILMRMYGPKIEVEQACDIFNIVQCIWIVFFYILSVILICLSFIIAYRKLQKNYSSKKFQFQRDGSVISDIKFITTWLFIGIPFHIIMFYFGVNRLISSFSSTYFVLSTIFYLLLRRGWCGHKIRRRTRVLKL
jgi:hypothetical protein